MLVVVVVCGVQGLVIVGRRGCRGGGLRSGVRVLGWMLVRGCERDGFVRRSAPWSSLPFMQLSCWVGCCRADRVLGGVGGERAQLS